MRNQSKGEEGEGEYASTRYDARSMKTLHEIILPTKMNQTHWQSFDPPSGIVVNKGKMGLQGRSYCPSKSSRKAPKPEPFNPGYTRTNGLLLVKSYNTNIEIAIIPTNYPRNG